MIIIGIDPGLNGAIAIIEGKKVISLFDMPVMAEGKKNKRQLNSAQLVHILKNNIKNFENSVVVVEQVNAMPGQGVTSMFWSNKMSLRSVGIINLSCSTFKMEKTF